MEKAMQQKLKVEDDKVKFSSFVGKYNNSNNKSKQRLKLDEIFYLCLVLLCFVSFWTNFQKEF